MKIAIISGSARPQRQSHQVAREILSRVEKKGHKAWMFDVREQNLPLLENTFKAELAPSDQLKLLGASLAESDAFIIVSPEYNGSYSGALKNSMDYFYQEYANKAFGLVGVSAGMLGGINAVRNMQQYALSLNGIVHPSYLITPKVQSLFKDGELTDEGYSGRMNKFLERFMWLAQLLAEHAGKE